MRQQTDADGEKPSPWWRHRFMWLVVGGPLAVVIAAIATAVIAIRGADPVIDESAAASRAAGTSAARDLPALKARNHAATGGQ